MEAVVVGANIVEREGAILLVREGKPSVAGTWNLPGGRMRPREHPAECARREASEETGLEVDPTSLVGVYLDRSPVVDDDVLVIVFRSKTDDRPAYPSGGDSVVEVQWTAPEDIDDLDVRGRYVTAAVEDYVTGVVAPAHFVTDLRW